eukprot:TRINITY_DN155_c0_g1_i2.p1 TRINITY_DN155_c0_g1~~TRINITY_DN155_c0_g1_i2.p1  ORF type:complete len:319 (+),score=135.32 TRINITY_DN155_c0_g1_i2:99-1055(+)
MRFTTLLFSLLALFLVVSAASDKKNDPKFKRALKVTDNKNMVRITSKQSDEDGKTFISYILRNTPVITSRLRVMEKSADEASSDSLIASRLRVFEIVEFNPTTEKPTYEDGMDVVSRYSFKDATFGDFIVGKEDADGIIAISTTTSDNIVSIKYELASSIVEKTDYTVSPNSAKFDLEINNFDYKGTATKLAVGYILDTKEAVRQRTTSTEQDEGVVAGEEEAEIETNGMFFSYKKKVRAGSKDVDVTASAITEDTADTQEKDEGETAQKVYFTIDDNSQPDSIVWDPKIGVSDAGLDSPAAVFLPSIALLALLALFL